MPHWKTMMDKEFMGAHDLEGRERTLEIANVTAGEVIGEGNKKSKKPVASFANAKKKLALNSTNCKTIAALYGNDTVQWRGKLITIYPTTTKFGGEVVDCIRVKPVMPPASKSAPANDAARNDQPATKEPSNG